MGLIPKNELLLYIPTKKNKKSTYNKYTEKVTIFFKVIVLIKLLIL